MKICMISSSGGHLIELLALKRVVDKHEHFWITFKSPITGKTLKGEKFYLVDDPRRNPIKFLKLAFDSFRIFIKERPDVVITTGAGVAIPFSYIAKLFRKRLILIESFSRTQSRSLTGIFLYPIADLFLVQWKHMVKKYGKNAIYCGSVY